MGVTTYMRTLELDPLEYNALVTALINEFGTNLLSPTPLSDLDRVKRKLHDLR